MLSRSLALSFVLASTALLACTSRSSSDDAVRAGTEALSNGPGHDATDARVPELGKDITIVRESRIWMADAVAKVARENGPVIEAKFELGDDGKLSLSLYPAERGLQMDSERSVFKELAGDPTVLPFTGSLAAFDDQEHVLRSSRDLTLVQLSRLGVADAVATGSDMGKVFWAIPTIRNKRAGYGVYAVSSHDAQMYRFIDGQGGDESNDDDLEELGPGPGPGATDARTPELGNDLTLVRQSRVSMSHALAALEGPHGPAIEAKFEIGDDGKLSLSVYPVGRGIEMDAERNTFFELAGDPTAPQYNPEKAEFKMPDFEHVARSARDLTLVQTARLTLRQAVDAVDEALPGGFVYWAIPTIRGTNSGYGVYTLGADNKPHYFLFADRVRSSTRF